MKKRIISLVLAAIMLVGMCVTVSFADSGNSEIYEMFKSYEIEKNTYADSETNLEVDVVSYIDTSVPANGAVILYVINHNGEYPGTESDETIIDDFLADGYLVAVVDYKDNPLAKSPLIETSVQYVRDQIRTSGKFVGSYKIDSSKTFVIPAGYRLKRDVTYFEIATQSSNEAIKHIIDTWNAQESVIKKVSAAGYNLDENGNWIKAETLYDIVMADGSKMTAEDTQLKLDIIYPSKPIKETPVAVLASSGTPRGNNGVKINRQHNVGFLFRGYTSVVYDHEYMPFMNIDRNGWGHFEPAYTFQTYDGVKTHTAAIRCIKYFADELGYSSEKIGVYGHSKSSYSSLLSNPEAESLPESGGYCPPIGEQPYLTDKNGNPLNADITCMYHSMGNGSSRSTKILTPQSVPTIICCGQKDSGNGPSYWETEKAGYLESGIPFLAIDMVDLGHDYPNGDDTIYDYNRYEAFCKFFDYYLKDTAPEILYSSVKDGQLRDVITTTAKYDSSNPANHWKEVEGDKLFVQFTAPITEWSFLEAVTLTDSDGNEVEGEWYAEGAGNRWIFGGKLVDGKSYTLTVDGGIAKDINQRAVETGITVQFTK